MKFNPSLIKNWMGCPLQQKLSQTPIGKTLPRLTSGNMAYGTAVHAALEAFNEGSTLEEATEFFITIWDNPKLVDNEVDYYYPRTSYGQFREKGIEVIKDYAESREWDAREVIATEHRFCVPFGEHTLSGIVDYLEYESVTDTMYIIDLKTGKRPSADQLAMDVQFTSYLYAPSQIEFWIGNPEEGERYAGFENGEELYEKYRNSTYVGIWYDLRNNKEYRVAPRTDQDFKRLYYCCESIASAVEHDVYVPDISADTCKWCDYKSICPSYIEPNEEQYGELIDS